MNVQQVAVPLSVYYFDDRPIAGLTNQVASCCLCTEKHCIRIQASPERIMQEFLRYRLQNNRLFVIAIFLRELPQKLLARLFGRSKPAKPFDFTTFTVLEQSKTEIVYGLVGRFWALDFGLEPVQNGDEFVRANEPGVAKLALTFCASETQFTTESRVYCPDWTSWLKFLPPGEKKLSKYLMYNGIGLSTARGSGTNGYVQRNLTNVYGDSRIDESGGKQYLKRQLRQKSEQSQHKRDGVAVRDREIASHERKRAIELKVAEYMDELEDQGVEGAELDEKVAVYREKLRQEATRDRSPKRAPQEAQSYGTKPDPFTKKPATPSIAPKQKPKSFANMY
ncbi:hypothetical protein OGAPHI_002984 [Ogataea philodendri]|uniref:Pre-mRNA-splicing factor CWC21 n=1 Tax=Ogataea philodendri TaxID=1378263 RepID=A0A9P8P8U6_9ASCO|nr:uncharacterized protein OGAPHI_002984 [Ogataea philodendri]KAH3667335.1 hypothetical protein OGAPHI_002984 [Ogataea philodendri]